MAVPITLGELDILDAVRNFLLAILPTGVDAFQGQANRVPEPMANDFIIMTMMNQEGLATVVETWDGEPNPASLDLSKSTQFAVQLDVHGGDDCAANAARIAMLWRSAWGAQFLAETIISPLYASEPTQSAFENAESQVETRWIVTIYLQANPVVTVPQDYAAALDVSLFYEVDR